MRVTGVRLSCFRIPFRDAYTTAAGSASQREGMLFSLKTASGETGLGEASFLPASSQPFQKLSAAAIRLGQGAVGCELDDFLPASAAVRDPCDRIVWGGLESAAWDAKARSRGASLAALLCPNPRGAVPVNALVSAPGVPDAEEAARDALARGFGSVKLKVGMAASLSEERLRVAAVRAVLGPKAKLRLDANGAWQEHQAIEAINSLSEFDIEFVEQPVPPGDIASLRRVRLGASVPIAADEDVTDIESAKRIIQGGAAQVLVLKPIQVGGIAATLSIAAQAIAAGIKPVVTTSIDSGVGTAVALQIAATIRNDFAAGLATADLLDAALTEPAFSIERGLMAVPARPGIGVDLDENELARFVTDRREFGRIE